jgi:methionine-rich copper-binding protein CopC
MSRNTVALATTLLLAGALTGVAASPAAAHNVVVATTPQAGETLTALPDAFSITTSEPMLELAGGQGFALQIRDAAGLFYGDGCIEVSGPTLSAEPALGAPGAYEVLWQAVSEDGHTIDGTIPFTWAPEGEVEASPGFAEPPVCGVDATPVPTESQTAAPEPSATAEPAPASGVDLGTVLWVGGALLALGVAAAIAIWFAGRRSRTGGE